MPKHIWGGKDIGANVTELFGRHLVQNGVMPIGTYNGTPMKLHITKKYWEINFNTPWRGVPKLMALLSQRQNVPIITPARRRRDSKDGDEPVCEMTTDFYPSKA